MAPSIFTCPNTDLKAQHLLEEDVDAPGNEYVAVTWPEPGCISSIERPESYSAKTKRRGRRTGLFLFAPAKPIGEERYYKQTRA